MAESDWNELLRHAGLAPNSFFSSERQQEGMQAAIMRLKEQYLQGQARCAELEARCEALEKDKSWTKTVNAEILEEKQQLLQQLEQQDAQSRSLHAQAAAQSGDDAALVASLRLQQQRLEEELEHARVQAGQLERERDQALSKLASEQDAASKAQQDRSMLQVDLQQQREAAAEGKSIVADLQAKTDKTVTEYREVAGQLADARARVQEQDAQIRDLDADMRQLAAKADGLEKDLLDARQDLHAAARREAQLAQEADSAESRLRQLSTSGARSEDVIRLEQLVQQLQDEKLQLEHRDTGNLRAEAQEREDECRRLYEDLERARGQLSDQQQDQDDLQQQLQHERTQNVTLRDEVAEVRAKYEQLVQDNYEVQDRLERKMYEAQSWGVRPPSGGDLAETAMAPRREAAPRTGKERSLLAPRREASPVREPILQTLRPVPDKRTMDMLNTAQYDQRDWAMGRSLDGTWTHVRQPSPPPQRAEPRDEQPPADAASGPEDRLETDTNDGTDTPERTRPRSLVVNSEAKPKGSPTPQARTAWTMPPQRLLSGAALRSASPLASPLPSPLGSPRASLIRAVPLAPVMTLHPGVTPVTPARAPSPPPSRIVLPASSPLRSPRAARRGRSPSPPRVVATVTTTRAWADDQPLSTFRQAHGSVRPLEAILN